MPGYWKKGVEVNPIQNFIEKPDLPVIYHDDPQNFCGHWHKKKSYSSSCVDFVAESDITATPPSISDHISKDLLVYTNCNNMIYGGSATDGTIFQLDPNSMAVTLETTFPGTVISGFKQLIISECIIYALIEISGYTGNWIQKITLPSPGDSDFVLVDAPLYCGAVTLGTDGNIYGAYVSGNSTAFWAGLYTPVTGALWNIVWEVLPAGYGYAVASLTTWGGFYFPGAKLVNFCILPGKGYLLNNGPSSSGLATSAIIHSFTFAGDFLSWHGGNTIIGPNEIVLDASTSQAVLFRCISATSGLTMRWISTNSTAWHDYLITGLVDHTGALYDGSVYHRRTIWHHESDVIYNLHGIWPLHKGRIIAVSITGELLYQYNIPVSGGIGGGLWNASFIILGDYIYIWQGSMVRPGYASGVIKLTLDLRFVCLQDCSGGYKSPIYTETGGHIVSDGEQYIYNYNKAASPIDGLITKYKGWPPVGATSTHCDPVWEFTKQPNTY